MRSKLVVLAVTGQEGRWPSINLTDCDRGARRPVRRVDDDTIATLIKERVKSAPSDYRYIRIQLSQLLVMAQFLPFRRGNFPDINRSSVDLHGHQREQ